MKLYFHPDGDRCYELSIHLAEAREDGLEEIELYEAMPVPEGFECRKWTVILQRGDGWCGKACTDYSPCNGKSGKCRHMGNAYTIGEKVTFKV